MIKIALFGAGFAGRDVLQSFKSIKYGKITAVADIDHESLSKLQKEFAIEKVTTEYTELLSDDSLDLVCICTPHALHYRMAMDALSAGKHVICEKPIAINLDQADEIVAKANAVGKRLFVTLRRRFNPFFQKASQLLKDEKIGRPFLLESMYIGDEVDRIKNHSNWKGRRKEAGGGVLMDAGTHQIDIARYYLGEVDSVIALSSKSITDIPEKAEDTALTILKHRNGCVTNITTTFAVRSTIWAFRGCNAVEKIYGTEGSLHVTNTHRAWLTMTRGEEVFRFSHKDVVTGLPTNAHEHFLECLINGREPIVTAHDARMSLAIVLAAYESAISGSMISLKTNKVSYSARYG